MNVTKPFYFITEYVIILAGKFINGVVPKFDEPPTHATYGCTKFSPNRRGRSFLCISVQGKD
jgi:hypothetical protein